MGDVASIATSIHELIGASVIATGGNLLGVAATPFTADASIMVIPVTATGVATIVGPHGSVALVSATERLGKGHSWDPSFNKPINNSLKKLIDEVPSEFKVNGKCDKFADALEKLLKENGVEYKRLKVESEFLIYSDKAGESIGNNGYHDAIRVGDKVYDNLTLNGMKYDDWLLDLGIGIDPSIRLVE